MAEAKITLQLTPREFDLIREVLDGEHKRCLDVGDDKHTDVAIRHQHRKQAVLLNDLLMKLR